jgi:hypothetical protein
MSLSTKSAGGEQVRKSWQTWKVAYATFALLLLGGCDIQRKRDDEKAADDFPKAYTIPADIVIAWDRIPHSDKRLYQMELFRVKPPIIQARLPLPTESAGMNGELTKVRFSDTPFGHLEQIDLRHPALQQILSHPGQWMTTGDPQARLYFSNVEVCCSNVKVVALDEDSLIFCPATRLRCMAVLDFNSGRRIQTFFFVNEDAVDQVSMSRLVLSRHLTKWGLQDRVSSEEGRK